MSNLIKLDNWKLERKDGSKISIRDTHSESAAEFSERITRIKESLARINELMAQLKKTEGESE